MEVDIIRKTGVEGILFFREISELAIRVTQLIVVEGVGVESGIKLRGIRD